MSAEIEEPQLGRMKRLANWLAEHESITIAIGMAFTSLSLIISAVTAGIAWWQMSLINEERNTPYDVAFYQIRLESFRNIVDLLNQSHFDDSCYSKENMTGVKFVKCVENLLKADEKLSRGMTKEILVWPKPIRDKLADIPNQVVTLHRCMVNEMASQFSNADGTLDCPDSADTQQKKYDKLWKDSIEVMLGSLDNSLRE